MKRGIVLRKYCLTVSLLASLLLHTVLYITLVPLVAQDAGGGQPRSTETFVVSLESIKDAAPRQEPRRPHSETHPLPRLPDPESRASLAKDPVRFQDSALPVIAKPKNVTQLPPKVPPQEIFETVGPLRKTSTAAPIPASTSAPQTPAASSAKHSAAAGQQSPSASTEGSAATARDGEMTEPMALMAAGFGEVGGPRVLSMPPLHYPPHARRLHKEGRVLLLLELNGSGTLEEASILESAGFGFDEAAMQAIEEARFAPAEDRGRRVACRAILPISFRLQSSR